MHCRWLDVLYLFVTIFRGLTSANQINIRRAEPIAKSNSYQNCQRRKKKHIFHWEKPSVTFFALLSVNCTFQLWYYRYYGSYANLLRSRHCCYQMNVHFSCWSSPLAASSSSMDADWFNRYGLATSAELEADHTITKSCESSFHARQMYKCWFQKELWCGVKW